METGTPLALRAVRVGLRVLPRGPRERVAARLFLVHRDHGEPERERALRARGEPADVAGCAATAFGPAQGQTALLLHGWEGRGLQLGAFIEPLAASGFRVLAVDAPGHGRSDGVASLPTWADWFEAALVETAPRLVVAHSFGAAVAVVAAARTGWRGRLLCLGGPPETQEMFDSGRALLGLGREGQDRFVAALRERFADHRWEDLTAIAPAARRLRCEVVVMNGEHDEPVRHASARGVAEAAHAPFVLIPEAGHRDIMWHPEAVARGIGFLLGDASAIK